METVMMIALVGVGFCAGMIMGTVTCGIEYEATLKALTQEWNTVLQENKRLTSQLIDKLESEE